MGTEMKVADRVKAMEVAALCSCGLDHLVGVDEDNIDYVIEQAALRDSDFDCWHGLASERSLRITKNAYFRKQATEILFQKYQTSLEV